MEDYEKEARTTTKVALDRIKVLQTKLDDAITIFSREGTILPVRCREVQNLMDVFYEILSNLATVYLVVSPTNVYMTQGLIDNDGGLKEDLHFYQMVCMETTRGEYRLKKRIRKELEKLAEHIKLIQLEYQPYYPTN